LDASNYEVSGSHCLKVLKSLDGFMIYHFLDGVFSNQRTLATGLNVMKLSPVVDGKVNFSS